MTNKEPEGVALEDKTREYLHYDADIDTLKNFMQKLADKESLDKFLIQQGVISLYQQLHEEITPPQDIENAWRRILITDSCDDECSSDYNCSYDDADIDTLKNFMQKLADKDSLDKFLIQHGVISLYKQLKEEITPPRDIENAWRRILITDSCDDEYSSDYKCSCDDTDYYE